MSETAVRANAVDANHPVYPIVTTLLDHRYELRYRISSGGMTEVYAAYDRTLEHSVVVKLLQEQFATDPIANEKLRREGEALAAIASPRVVALYDIGVDGDRVFLVLERIHGLTLEQELRRFGPICPPRASSIALDVLAGLNAIHKRGFVHRNLEPSNVIVDFDDRAVLLDLGVADSVIADPRADLSQLASLVAYMTTGRAHAIDLPVLN